MRKILSLYPFALAALMVFFTACEETDRAFPEFGDPDLQTGAYARLIGDIEGIFDYDNIADSKITFTVELYDVNQGRDVASYSWAAVYNGMGPVAVSNFDASQFSPNSEGLPQLTITITMQEVMDALGVTQDDLQPGLPMELQATITMNDGRTFNEANTAANIEGQPLFRGLFLIRQTIENLPYFGRMGGDGYTLNTTVTNQMAGISWDNCDGLTYSTVANIFAEPDGSDGSIYKIFTQNANGDFVEDAAMAAYYACYSGADTDPGALPNGDLAIEEDGGALTWAGVSQWEEVYTFEEVTVNGMDLTLGWTNDYGEGGIGVFTRDTDWPTEIRKGQ